MRALAGLLLEPLELVDRALARLLEQPLLDVRRACSIEKTRKSPSSSSSTVGVARGARRLLVGGEERVLERVDERARPRSPSRARSSRTASMISLLMLFLPFVDQVAPHDRLVRDVDGSPSRLERSTALLVRRRRPRREALRPRSRRPCAARPCGRRRCGSAAGVRSGRSMPGDETSTVYSSQVAAQHVGDALAERVVDALRRGRRRR